MLIVFAALAALAVLSAGVLGSRAAQAGFVALALVLLLTPGPTNTLLALAGAAQGWRAALPLLAAELCGYGLAIAALVLALGTNSTARPEIAAVLCLAASLYLAHLAWRLWRGAAAAKIESGPAAPAIGFRRVLVTTLLNPKALVFAFALLPPAGGWPDARNLLLLALLIPAAGACWIRLGVALGAGALRDLDLGRIHRGGAILLALFALLLPLSALFG